MPIEIGKKFKEKIVARYPALNKSKIPANYKVNTIEYKKTAIEECHVIFWHRLLRSLYDMPIEIECEIQDKSPRQRTDIQMAFFRKTREKNNWEAIGIDEKTAIGIQADQRQLFFPVNDN
jgi:hypothetical protein